MVERGVIVFSPQSAEVSYKTPTKKIHEAVVGCGSDFGASSREGGHYVVGIDLMGVENRVFAVGNFEDFLPNLLTIFQL